MIITVKRTGGFAGLTTSKSLDLQTLSPADSDHVTSLVEQSGLPDGADIVHKAPAGSADHFTYKVLVDDGPRQLSGTYTDSNPHLGLKAIYDFVTKRQE
jgi:hypothetical protein